MLGCRRDGMAALCSGGCAAGSAAHGGGQLCPSTVFRCYRVRLSWQGPQGRAGLQPAHACGCGCQWGWLMGACGRGGILQQGAAARQVRLHALLLRAAHASGAVALRESVAPASCSGLVQPLELSAVLACPGAEAFLLRLRRRLVRATTASSCAPQQRMREAALGGALPAAQLQLQAWCAPPARLCSAACMCSALLCRLAWARRCALSGMCELSPRVQRFGCSHRGLAAQQAALLGGHC